MARCNGKHLQHGIARSASYTHSFTDASRRTSGTTVHGRHQRERKRTRAIGKTGRNAARETRPSARP
eukprot:669701-Alexandrium_andersonii.AAC.1